MKREMDTAKKSGTILAAESQSNDVQLYKELEALKAERNQVGLKIQGNIKQGDESNGLKTAIDVWFLGPNEVLGWKT